MAEPPSLPPSLKATLAVLTPGEAPGLAQVRSRGPAVEGAEWVESWPRAGLALLRVPLLLPGARIKGLLRGAVGEASVAREVRELRLLMEAARDALREESDDQHRRALLAMADALEPLDPGITMLRAQEELRRALGKGEVRVVSLSHYDALVVAPADLDLAWVRSAVARAYTTMATRPVAVVLRRLADLEALLPRLPPR